MELKTLRDIEVVKGKITLQDIESSLTKLTPLEKSVYNVLKTFQTALSVKQIRDQLINDMCLRVLQSTGIKVECCGFMEGFTIHLSNEDKREFLEDYDRRIGRERLIPHKLYAEMDKLLTIYKITTPSFKTIVDVLYELKTEGIVDSRQRLEARPSLVWFIHPKVNLFLTKIKQKT